jgi:hypothetical protein
MNQLRDNEKELKNEPDLGGAHSSVGAPKAMTDQAHVKLSQL